MIPLKFVLLPALLTFLSCYSHGGPDEALPFPEDASSPPPKSLLRRQALLSPYAGAAFQNARCFTERWRQKFERATGFSSQRKTLKHILNEAHQELLHITQSPSFQEDSPSSPFSCHEAICQAVQRRRLPSFASDTEDPSSTLITALRLSLRQTQRHHLTSLAPSLFSQLLQVFYEESLKRLTRESWVRTQLFDSTEDGPEADLLSLTRNEL